MGPRAEAQARRRLRARTATPTTTAATASAAPHSATSTPVAGSAPERGGVASGIATDEGVGAGLVGAALLAGTCTWITIESPDGSAAAASTARGNHRTDATSTAAVALRGVTGLSVSGESDRGATGG